MSGNDTVTILVHSVSFRCHLVLFRSHSALFWDIPVLIPVYSILLNSVPVFSNSPFLPQQIYSSLFGCHFSSFRYIPVPLLFISFLSCIIPPHSGLFRYIPFPSVPFLCLVMPFLKGSYQGTGHLAKKTFLTCCKLFFFFCPMYFAFSLCRAGLMDALFDTSSKSNHLSAGIMLWALVFREYSIGRFEVVFYFNI